MQAITSWKVIKNAIRLHEWKKLKNKINLADYIEKASTTTKKERSPKTTKKENKTIKTFITHQHSLKLPMNNLSLQSFSVTFFKKAFQLSRLTTI